MEKISVLFTVYNASNLLSKALISLQNQSFVPYEIIISDDGSDVDMLAGIKTQVDQLPCKLKYIYQEGKGFRAAKCRNNAIREACGDYLVFFDQDIISTKRYLETFVTKKQPNTFLVAYPVRLTEQQTRDLSPEVLISNDYSSIVTRKQVLKIKKQYIKDGFEYLMKKYLKSKKNKPKMRSGVFGIYRDDLLRVNGFDENYQGWGNEDDDLGRRLYRAGITGKNVFWSEFPLHLYHPPNHQNGARANKEYHRQRKIEIEQGHYFSKNGVINPLGDEKIRLGQLG
jgi:glycosyltransferase involved in cell wall biosynthesis